MVVDPTLVDWTEFLENSQICSLKPADFIPTKKTQGTELNFELYKSEIYIGACGKTPFCVHVVLISIILAYFEWTVFNKK